MKISVAIAAYKGEKFIGEQIASLLEQTLLPDEIVITDDSPDELTEKAVKKFSDPRIRYFRNDKQLGVNRNFERAISQIPHGIGLENIKAIVQKYQGECRIIAENGEFVFQMLLPTE